MKAYFKVLIPVFALILFTQCNQEPEPTDPIKIPDQSFQDALLEGTLDENGDLLIIDTNGDGLISYAEAEAITFLDVSDKGISDLSGIEEFINLEYLFCFNNQLTILDISDNQGLVELNCWNNKLSQLDVSNNAELRELDWIFPIIQNWLT